MARTIKTYTVLSCDWCETEADVTNRRFELDGKKRQLEACDDCWPTATVKELHDTGRSLRGGRRPALPVQASGAKAKKATAKK